MKVIDCDTHFAEPADLWVSRVPDKYKELVPHQIGDAESGYQWVVNGDEVLHATGGAGSVFRKDGTKKVLWDWDILGGMHISEVHEASYDPVARVEFMDRIGIWAQVMYPNLAGFGGHKLRSLAGGLGEMIISVYNDAAAEFQEASGERIFPMALLPFWDVDLAAEEARRAHDLGLRGIAMASEPHAAGLPDLPDRHWDPLWEVCSELQLPINLHVGASEFGMEAFMKGVWPSLDAKRKQVVGSVLIELHNGRVLANLLTSDLLVRFPDTRWVSVESGIGWIPYVLERLEHQLAEVALDGTTFDQPSATELFRRQVYSCFWFEESGPSKLLEDVGFDNVLFETDFPHPTSLHPDAVEHAKKVLAPWGEDVQRKVLQDNAADLYRIPV